MRLLRRWFDRPLALWRSPQIHDEISEELGHHIDQRTEDNIRAGMSPDAAERDARRRFGPLTRIKEQGYDVRGPGSLGTFVGDLRFGLRILLRSPGFSILALLCLTLGIGATAAVFSWIEGTLVRPYPLVVDQDRLLVLSGTAPGAGKGDDVSWPDFVDFRRDCTLFEAFIAEKIVGTTIGTGGGRAERAPGSVVSANYFEALGVRPVLGRGFEASEEVGRGAHPVVVISYQLWRDRFGSDRAIIGKTQRLNGVPHTIVGVAPEGFFGTFVGYAFQFWVPASMQETFDPGGYKLEDRGARWIEGFARLKPGVTMAQAQAEIQAVAARLAAKYPSTNRARGLRLRPLWQSPFNPMELLLPTLGIALAVVTAVLLVACANVGNLLLLKSLARRGEMTVRLAVGAARGRLVRQMLTEGLILATIGTGGGLLVAQWCRSLLVLLFPTRGGITLRLAAELDWRVLAVTGLVCVASTLCFALAPAIVASDIDLAGALKSEWGGAVGARDKARVRSGLVVLQVALSFVLLVGGALVIQSLQRMRATNPGFAADDVLSTAVDVIGAGYDVQRTNIFQDALLDRVRSIPGVDSAAYVRVTPFSYRGYSSAAIAVAGYQTPPDQPPQVDYDEVGPAYFATMGIPLVSGREFTRNDNETADAVAVVNEAMAREFWPETDPVGRRLVVKGRAMRIVGVARMSKLRNLLETPRPFFYVPLRQSARGQGLVIRTRVGPGSLASALTREIHALDPDLAPLEVITMRQQVDRTASSQLVAVRLLTVFGGLALALAGIGLYGVMSYVVSQGTRELGLKLALGATPAELLRGVVTGGLALTSVGILVGAAAAFELTRLLGNLLYEVSPRDPGSFVAALVVMTLVSVLACVLPAWRAMRTDLVSVLRA